MTNNTISELLNQIQDYLNDSVNAVNVSKILKLIKIDIPAELLEEARIYSDLLPMGREINPYTPEQRLLHLLWESLNKSPYSILIDFSIPFRRLIAQRLFKKCGKNFIALDNIVFNYGHLIEVGDDVFWNSGCFIDSKGGFIMENSSCLTEYVKIFTHNHSESLHRERTYAPVIIKEYAKIYTEAMLLPGVVVGKQGIVAAKSVVSKNVEDNMLVAGSPARVIRERRNEGNMGNDLAHMWLADSEYQKD